MATVALLAALFLSWCFFAFKRKLKRQRRSETVAAKSAGRLLELSVSLSIVLLFYHALLAVVLFGWRWMTIGDLQRLESQLVSLQHAINEYKPSWSMWFGVLVVLYLTSRMWINFLAKETPFRFIKETKRVVQVASTVAFLLASFTLLGFDPGQPAATLDIELRRARTEYGLLRRDLRTALIDVSISGTYHRVQNTVPAAKEITSLLDRSYEQRLRLIRIYAEAKSRGVRPDPDIDALLKRYDQQDLRLQASHIEANRDTRDADEGSPPEDASYQDISKARTRLEEFEKRVEPKILRFLNQPGGKEILLEIPGGIINGFADVLTPWTNLLPRAKPVFDTMKSIASDSAKLLFKRKLDEVTASVLKNPEKLPTAVPEAAEEIVDSSPPNLSPDLTRELNAGVKALQRDVAHLEAEDGRIRRRIDIAESRRPAPTEPPETWATEAASRRPRSTPHEERAAEAERIPLQPYPQVRPYPETTSEPIPRPYTLPADPPISGGGTLPSSGGQCICNTYIDGALVSSVPISPGQVCGGQVCR